MKNSVFLKKDAKALPWYQLQVTLANQKIKESDKFNFD